MPFCPNCRTEYVGDASRCADCGTELVARLSHRDSSPDLSATRPELLCDVDSLVQADLIESQLRAADRAASASSSPPPAPRRPAW
jgi:hypothetical protein